MRAKVISQAATARSMPKATWCPHDASKFVAGSKMPTWNGIIAEDEYPRLIEYLHELERAAPAH